MYYDDSKITNHGGKIPLSSYNTYSYNTYTYQPQIQHQMSGSLSEVTTLNESNPSYPNIFRPSRYSRPSVKKTFLKVPISDDRIEALLSDDIISKPEKLYELKKLAEDYPTQWSSKCLINSLERLCDTSSYNHTSHDTVIMLELHLRTFSAVLEALVQNPVILNHKLREKLYKKLTDFNNVHHNVSVAMEQGLNKTWKGKLQHLNVDNVELQTGGIKRNYNIDFLLIHLRDTLHSLSDDETKFREGWRRTKDLLKAILGVAPSAIPHFPADNSSILTTWNKLRAAFGFKVPVSSWYKDWRLLLMLKQTLNASYQKDNNQNLRKFGERMLLEYLWFHIKKITSQIVPSKDEDFEFSKIFNNKKRLFAELSGIEPLSYPHMLWFGILDLAASACESSTRSITLSLCYYLALESLNHAPSTFIRFKAVELLLSLEYRRRDWFAVVDEDLKEYANRFEKKSKFFSLIDCIKSKLVTKEEIMKKIFSKSYLDDDFPAFTNDNNNNNNSKNSSNSSILSLLAQELLCPVMLQITDQYYSLNCGHIISKGAFNIYKAFQSKKGKELVCSICRTVIEEKHLTSLPQTSTLDALSERFIAAGLLSNQGNGISEYEISTNPDTITSEEPKKPSTSMPDVVSRQLTSPTDPPDPLQCARECFQQNPQNPQKALLILDKILQNKAKFPQALLERAKIYDYLKRYGEALFDVNKVLQYDNHNIEVYQFRAHLHFQLKNYDNSLSDISIVINRIESNKTENEDYKYTSSDLSAYELKGKICIKLGSFYHEAISGLCIVLENDILNFVSLAIRGAIFRELRKYKEALEDLTKAIKHDPNYMFAIAQRGSVYCKLDRFSQALDDLNKVLDDNTASEEDKLFARAERGDLFCKQNKFYEASCDLDSVLEQDPQNIFARSRKGYVLFMLKKYDASLEDLNKVLTLDKANYYALTYRGMIYQQFNDYKNSLRDFNTVLDRFPNNSIAIRQRAIVYFSMGKYEESLNDFDKLINLNMNDINALCYRACILYELGRYKDSFENCNTILQFNSSNVIALRTRGIVLRRSGQNDKALIDLDKVLLQQPDNTIALRERAAVYMALHQYQRSLADFEKMLYLEPQESVSSFQERTKIYGDLIEAIGVDEILIHLERVLQDSPRNSLALTTRAYIYLLQWNCDEAIHDLNCALEYRPNYILSLYQRSMIYRITQNYSNALKDLEKILELEPGNNFAQTERNEIESMKDFDRNQLFTSHCNRYNHRDNRSSSESSFSSSRSSISTSERSRRINSIRDKNNSLY